MTRDLLLFLCGDNLNLIGGKPKYLQTLGSRGSSMLTVLPNPAGKDKQVHPAQQSS